MVVAPGAIAVVVRVDACAERCRAKEERQRAREPCHVWNFLAVCPCRAVCPLSIAPALRLVRMSRGIRGTTGRSAHQCRHRIVSAITRMEMSGRRCGKSSAGTAAKSRWPMRPAAVAVSALLSQWMPRASRAIRSRRGSARQEPHSSYSVTLVGMPCSLGRGVALLPWLAYPRRMGLATIRSRFVNASYLLMTGQRRNAAEQVERLDEGCDQRKALHGSIPFRFRICMQYAY